MDIGCHAARRGASTTARGRVRCAVAISNTEVCSASHKSCAASARATTLKILRRKRFRKPKEIIASQAQPLAQV